MKRLLRAIRLGVLFSAAVFGATGDLRLIEAVKNGDIAAVRSLLDQHFDINAAEPDGATALAWAAERDDIETADLLIQSGANVNAANDNGATPLWLAATRASARMTEKLLGAGANPNAALVFGETALMAAASTGSMDVVRALVTHGADVNAREIRGSQTALMWAIAEKRTEVARYLIEHGADVKTKSKAGLTPFLFAAQQGDLDSARLIAAAGADISAPGPDGRSPLLIASAGGHEPLAIFLLGKGANPNAADRLGLTALHYAATAGKLELIKPLLAAGANPNSRAIRERANSGPYSTVDYPPVSIIGATPLFLAAEAGNAEAVRFLAANGADPQLSTNEKTTPLIVAAGAGVYQDLANDQAQEEWKQRHFETGKVLADLGVDVNAKGENGWTVLHAATYMGLDSLIQLLVEKGAKLDVMDNFGQTPLSIAEGVITVGLGNAANRRPRNVRRTTADLLLKLGATPLETSGVQISIKKGK
ncbi:MAG TPA: ankyrin repeat domain-containing protein [Terriglobia bacterium]|nr:ankyrin repeat domain-containing protein [Terriglobia bacterium]